MLCQQLRQLMVRDGSRVVREHPLLGQHIGECDVCRALVQKQERQQLALQQSLADMPVPDPGDDFEARLLARVLPARRRGARATGGAGGLAVGMVFGLAASLLLGVLLVPQLISTPDAQPQVLEHALRPVHVRLDSPRALDGATIRIQLPAHTSLRGFQGVQNLQWQTDIPAGANRITLPLQVDGELAESELAGASLTIEVEYRGAKKTLRYSIPEVEPATPSPSLIKL
ncbi:hypothetical protein [uncultured Microbulbifer sp.]|uniref:hypothetical protein n=1 Tax=uncultured Microbulbifer sp. TaxID=348147 RepID=UPI00263397A6|nr:hypothetical protein [uncultured Microbulbifer sp.]